MELHLISSILSIPYHVSGFTVSFQNNSLYFSADTILKKIATIKVLINLWKEGLFQKIACHLSSRTNEIMTWFFTRLEYLSDEDLTRSLKWNKREALFGTCGCERCSKRCWIKNRQYRFGKYYKARGSRFWRFKIDENFGYFLRKAAWKMFGTWLILP